MFSLALRTLRFRTGGFIAAFVAAFLGAVIVSACAGLMETGIRSATPPHRLAWTSAVVAGQQDFELQKHSDKPKTQSVNLAERVRLDRSLADQIRATPGVSTVVGAVNFPVSLGKQPLTAHGWESARLPGPAPRADEVVLPAATGVSAGATVDLAVQGTMRQYRVARTSDQPDAFFADDVADQLSGHPGKVDYFGVVTDNPTALQLGSGVSVLTGDERGLAEFPEAQASGGRLIPLSGVAGGLSISVAVFVIASTLMLSVRQRQRELALLRAIGTTLGSCVAWCSEKRWSSACSRPESRPRWARCSADGCSSSSPRAGSFRPPCSSIRAGFRCSSRRARPCSRSGFPRWSPDSASVASGRPKRSPKPPCPATG
ncbi:FtsX-like permease family protein [Amycolatopsis sp. WGS_07]